MTRSMRFFGIVAVLAVCATMVAPSFARDLPKDPRIITGKLDNGLIWIFRKHDNPPGKMAMQIHVRAGSLYETEEQRGLAHFMEHMSFNGSEHFAPGELFTYFEGIGMQFGPDLNAFTTFDQTVYQLYLPSTDKEQIAKGLMVLSDYAYRLLLTKEEIENERGVILEESRTGKNAGQRVRDKLWPELFEGSRFAERLPIGLDEIIATAPREEFVKFYGTWYRPDRITLVMVGDTDYTEIIPLVEKWFGTYAPKLPPGEPKGPEFKPFTKQRAIVVTDTEQMRCQVQMWNIRPGRPPTVTVEQMRTEAIEYVGTWILDRRYEERVAKGEASYRFAGASVMDFFSDAMVAMGTAVGEPADWNKMLDELVTEVHRAREFGFTQREWDLAKKEILADLEQAVKTEPSRNARGIIREIVSSVNDRIPVLSARQELDLYKELLPTVSLSEVNAAFKDYFAPGTFAYVVTTLDKEGVEVPERDAVLAAARAAWARTVTPIEETDAPTTLLAAMPTPGKVVDTTKHDGLGVTSMWLDNGVRVHHRFMDYKKDQVLVSIALAGGEIEETAENAGITEVAALAVNQAATHRLSSTNVRDILTGKNTSISAGGQGDSFDIRVTGSPDDLETGLQAAYAVLTDGIIEESAFKNWKMGTLQRLEQNQKNPMFRGFEAYVDLISGGDPRRTLGSKEKVERQSVATAQAWFERLCAKAPIEVAVVGDMPLDAVQPLIEKYIGSLSKRARSASYLDALRKTSRSTGPWQRHVNIETITPQGMAVAGFATCQGQNTVDRRALDVASQVIDNQITKRIREELALAYSPMGMHRPAWIYEDSGTLMGIAQCNPENAEKTATELLKLFDEFAQNGPNQEELGNAKKQIDNDLDTEMQEPTYWWRILSHYDLHHRSLTEEAGEREAIAKLTADQVRTAFRKYFLPTRQFEITCVPVPPKDGANEPAGAKTATPGA